MATSTSTMPAWLRRHLAALRALLVFTVLLGLAYPLLITGISQLVFPGAANGSQLTSGDKVVGSSLIGQNFTDDKGNPLPRYFQSRPSAAGKTGYDPTSSGPSNLGPNNADLVKAIKQRRAELAAFNGVPESAVPADAVTASASGLDPDISPAYAAIQVARIAKTRGLSVAQVQQLVDDNTSGRNLGFIGDPHVNVLQLNLALDKLQP
ncbi:potassium-transporting ATPase subunit KdpC [Fodinicola feengrottensis]